MTIPNAYSAEDLTIWEVEEKGQWLYKISVDYTDQKWQKQAKIFETYDSKIENVLKDVANISMQILERPGIDDVASINWIDWLLKNLPHVNDNRWSANKKTKSKNVLQWTLTVRIKSGTSKGLNRWRLSPVSLIYKGKSWIFTLSPTEQIEAYPFQIWDSTLSIFDISVKWAVAKLWWIEWIVTWDILNIIHTEILPGS